MGPRSRFENGTRVEVQVTYAQAAKAILIKLAEHGAVVYYMSEFADIVWPGHHLTRQGAALAVSRIVRRMVDEGLLSYQRGRHSTKLGYGSTAAGRAWRETA